MTLKIAKIAENSSESDRGENRMPFIMTFSWHKCLRKWGVETSQEAPEEQIYKLTFRQVSILIRLPYGVVCVCSELLGIMAAHFPVSHSCPLRWLSIRPMNAVTMMHVWLQLLICTFKYQCKCITVLLLFEFQWRKEEAAVILNSWLWVQVLWAPVERNWRRITWTGHTANCWGGWHGADTAHWQSASEVKLIKCSSNIWFSIWFEHRWRAWLGSVLGAPVSSAVQELLAYRFNLQANGIDWKGLDVVMLINELIKCYFITLSHVQLLAMNTKQMQSSESQVSNWTTVPVASIRSLTLHWCSFF